MTAQNGSSMATCKAPAQANGVRIFKEQDSILTTLIEGNAHIRSLYNLICTFVVMFAVTTVGDYMVNHERFQADFAVFWWNIRDVYPHFSTPWLLMNAVLLLLLYPLVRFRHRLQWNNLQRLLLRKDGPTTKLDRIKLITEASQLGNLWSGALIGTYFVIIAGGVVGYCSWYIVHHQVSISISFALTMEMTRLVMKAHSYFVEKSYLSVGEEEMAKLMTSLQQNKLRSSLCTPRLLNLCYYMFAPTLIYRDSYPRTKKIRWRFVMVHSFQLVLAILVAFITINRFLVDHLSRTGQETFVRSNLFRNLGSIFVLGVILKLVNFYAFLHLWHNLTAELLRFADRGYYDEWWEATSLSEYYRKWNTLVQDWLYAYIYIPVYRHSASRSMAIYSVIFLSGIAHEYIVGFSIQFFFPLLFVFFAISGHVLFVVTKNLKQSHASNIFFILSTMLGWGLISFFYSMEWYSRTNCPVSNSSLADQIVPRLLSCVKLS